MRVHKNYKRFNGTKQKLIGVQLTAKKKCIILEAVRMQEDRVSAMPECKTDLPRTTAKWKS
jgi:hypothetical protein